MTLLVQADRFGRSVLESKVEMMMLRRSLSAVISAVGVSVSPWQLIIFPLTVNQTR